MFFCHIGNRDVGLDFHGMKSSEGDAAAPWAVHVLGAGAHTSTGIPTHLHVGNWVRIEVPEEIVCSPTQTVWPQMESSGKGRRGCLCCRKFCPLSSCRGGADIHSACQVFTACDSALPSVSIDNTAAHAQARVVSSDLLNLVSHWFGFRN